MKILFLDIDGVLNSKEDQMKGLFKTRFPIDMHKAFMVGKIQLDTGCKVVLSSAWRHHDESVEEINKRIVPILDKTGYSKSGIRGVEIHEWLKKNVEGFSQVWYDSPPEDFRIAILDDDGDMLLWQKNCFFKTSWEKGITEEIMKKVIEHLNK